jgi:hypothetical protein
VTPLGGPHVKVLCFVLTSQGTTLTGLDSVEYEVLSVIKQPSSAHEVKSARVCREAVLHVLSGVGEVNVPSNPCHGL